MAKPNKLKEIKEILELMRANGVVSYKNQGLELLLDPAAVQGFKHVQEKTPGMTLQTELNKVSPGFAGMSEDEVLFYSSNPTGN
jgi:hypothetical protein